MANPNDPLSAPAAPANMGAIGNYFWNRKYGSAQTLGINPLPKMPQAPDYTAMLLQALQGGQNSLRARRGRASTILGGLPADATNSVPSPSNAGTKTILGG